MFQIPSEVSAEIVKALYEVTDDESKLIDTSEIFLSWVYEGYVGNALLNMTDTFLDTIENKNVERQEPAERINTPEETKTP